MRLKGIAIKTRLLANIFTVLTIFGLSAPYAIAGGTSGGGGQHSCQEYSDLAGTIVHEMDKIEINSPGTFKKIAVDLSKYDDVIHGNTEKGLPMLTCIPVVTLDRDAWSTPGQDVTQLKWQSWDKLAMPEKIRLTIHELSVLTNNESDGQYFVSDDIIHVISASASLMRFELEADAVIFNLDGSVTFVRPFSYLGSNKVYFGAEVDKNHSLALVIPVDSDTIYDHENPDGVCKALGLSGVDTFTLSKRNVRHFLNADKNGHILYYSTHHASVFTVVFATDVDVYHGHPYSTLTCK